MMNRVLLLVGSAVAILSTAKSQSSRELRLYGMVRINDSTFMDRTEVTVADWLAFALDQQGVVKLDASMVNELPYGPLFYSPQPAKTKRVKTWSNGGTRVTVYLAEDSLRTRSQRYRADRYMDYPIAGITLEQANAFCAWRTDQRRVDYPKDTSAIEFDLPHPSEFENLLIPIDSTDGGCPVFNYGCVPCQVKMTGRLAFIHPGSELTPADAYVHDPHGLYGLRGNAAEMTSTPGIAKGGSYSHAARDAAPKAVQHYTGPEPWLGFRCVARIRRR